MHVTGRLDERVKKIWTEFKNFALGGNMIDLALGFIMGAAFAGLVESLAKNILMQIVAALFGQPDFSAIVVEVNGAPLKIGSFITDLVNFLLIAIVLFVMVRLIKAAGLGNFRAQGQRECPFCKEFVAIDAIVCKHCTSEIDPELLDPEDIPLLQKRPGWTPPGEH